jgi:hypothetical protein
MNMTLHISFVFKISFIFYKGYVKKNNLSTLPNTRLNSNQNDFLDIKGQRQIWEGLPHNIANHSHTGTVFHHIRVHI